MALEMHLFNYYDYYYIEKPRAQRGARGIRTEMLHCD